MDHVDHGEDLDALGSNPTTTTTTTSTTTTTTTTTENCVLCDYFDLSVDYDALH